MGFRVEARISGEDESFFSTPPGEPLHFTMGGGEVSELTLFIFYLFPPSLDSLNLLGG